MDTKQNTPNRDRINLMVREHAALEILELRERVTDLEGERDTYRFWWKKTLHALAEITTKYGRRHEDFQRLQDDLRDLRAIVVAESFGDAAAVMPAGTFAQLRAEAADAQTEATIQ